MQTNNKILCYVLIFDQVDIIKRSLDSLINLSDKLDIVVIENPSKNTPKIKKIIKNYSSQGLIKRYYLFEKNITSRAYDIILEHEQEEIKNYKYVVITDGDVTSTDEWIKEEKRALVFNPSLFCIGITFDMSNLPLNTFPDAAGWIPPDISKGGIAYREALTGMHFVMFRSSGLLNFLKYKIKKDINFIDGNIKEYVYETLHKKWGRTKKSRGIHLTWDLYQDLNHPYTKLKTSKSFKDTWYHKRSSKFTVESSI